jgi:hypothetical protein
MTLISRITYQKGEAEPLVWTITLVHVCLISAIY